MKIVADENIPLVKEFFGCLGEICLLPGRDIRAGNVKAADILLVRSVTPINKNLLANSKVKFVGSATAGVDHLDTAWLKRVGIGFANAKGSNAEAVAEYVVSCVANLKKFGAFSGNKAGVIGVGCVGSKVVEKLSLLGFEVIQNDPPRKKLEKNFVSAPLGQFKTCDLICVHTPLTHKGLVPTFHLLDKNFFQRIKSQAIVINAGRGAVVNGDAFKRYGKHLLGCFDVWEYEPEIDRELLAQALIATPHIAGYTLEAKSRGTFMLYQAAQNWFHFSQSIKAQDFFLKHEIELDSDITSWEDVVLKIYDPKIDTELLKALPEKFDEFRKHYPRRYEFASVVLKNWQRIKEKDRNILQQLGFNFS